MVEWNRPQFVAVTLSLTYIQHISNGNELSSYEFSNTKDYTPSLIIRPLLTSPLVQLQKKARSWSPGRMVKGYRWCVVRQRTVITERLWRGKLYRMRQGQLVSPTPPYGYRYVPVSEPDGGRWELDPLEAAIVRQIDAW